MPINVAPPFEYFDPEDPKKNIFTWSGFFDYVIRYGGGYMADDPRSDAYLTQQPLHNIRKYVLEQADKGTHAQETLGKFFNFRSGNPNKETVSISKARAASVKRATKCPLYYKVTPNIELFIESGQELVKLADNKTIKPYANGEVSLQIKNISLQITNDTTVKAGTIPIYQGTITLDYFSPNKTKKNDILQEIVSKKDTLGYLFQTGRPYYIKLSNSPKDIVAKEEDKEACDELIKQKILIESSTLKHELIEWKPYENIATFEITFVKSVNSLDRIDKPGTLGIPVISTRRDDSSLYAADVLGSIEQSLVDNNSLFKYKVSTIGGADRSFIDRIFARNREGIKNFYISVSAPNDGAPATAPKEGDPNTIPDRPIIRSGQFFMFRSLLIALVNTFYEGTTKLDKEAFRNSLFSKEVYDALNIFIDEEQVPTSSGYYWTSPAKTGFGNTTDVRNTFETLTIDFGDFVSFMNDISQKNQRMTFQFILQEIFNTLVPRVLKKSIRPGVDDKYCNMFGGMGSVGLFEGIDFSAVDIKGGYNIRFLDMKSGDRPFAQIERLIYSGRKTYEELGDKLESYGRTKIPYVSADTVTNLVGVGSTDEATDANQRIALVIQSNLADSRTEYKDDSDGLNVAFGILDRIGAAFDEFKTDEDFLKEGLINMVWFKKDKPEENLRNRLIASYGTNPFSFSSIDNKHLETAAAMQGGKKSIIKRIFNTSFSLSDVLLVEPFLSKFYFHPNFFGFSRKADDLFGYSGRYYCKSVSITYDQGQGRFVAQISAERELDILPEETARIAKTEKQIREAEQIFKLQGDLASIDNVIGRANLSNQSLANLIQKREQLAAQLQGLERIAQVQNEQEKKVQEKKDKAKTVLEERRELVSQARPFGGSKF